MSDGYAAFLEIVMELLMRFETDYDSDPTEDVFDLENKERLENPGLYSYEAVVEGFLGVGQYSEEMKKIFSRYKELYDKELTSNEAAEFSNLVAKLELVPPASKELYLAFRTMEAKRK